jgi:hypothetical protein
MFENIKSVDHRRVCGIRQSCQTWPAKFGQILLKADTRLVICNRKLMRTAEVDADISIREKKSDFKAICF